MKRDVLSEKTAKIDITFIMLQKIILSYKRATIIIFEREPEPWSRVHPMTHHTAKLINQFDDALFKYLNVYTYASTSKQKFPFVSEAKEGYLSTPPLSYSCMNIS